MKYYSHRTRKGKLKLFLFRWFFFSICLFQFNVVSHNSQNSLPEVLDDGVLQAMLCQVGRRVVGHMTVYVVIARLGDLDLSDASSLVDGDLHVPSGGKTVATDPCQAIQPFTPVCWIRTQFVCSMKNGMETVGFEHIFSTR